MILRHRANRECERARGLPQPPKVPGKNQNVSLVNGWGWLAAVGVQTPLLHAASTGRKLTVLPLISLSTGKSDYAATAQLRPRARKRVSTRLYAPKRYRHRGYTTVRLQYVCRPRAMGRNLPFAVG
jgi:hypothetical protein